MQPAGRLNQLVTIYRCVHTKSNVGQPTKSYAVQCQRWASIEPVGGNKTEKGEALIFTGTHKIYMGFVDGLTDEHRIVYRGKAYTLKAPEPSKDGRDMVIDATDGGTTVYTQTVSGGAQSGGHNG